jgi:hypothetical protein
MKVTIALISFTVALNHSTPGRHFCATYPESAVHCESPVRAPAPALLTTVPDYWVFTALGSNALIDVAGRHTYFYWKRPIGFHQQREGECVHRAASSSEPGSSCTSRLSADAV